MQHYERSMPTSLNLLALLELMQNMFFCCCWKPYCWIRFHSCPWSPLCLFLQVWFLNNLLAACTGSCFFFHPRSRTLLLPLNSLWFPLGLFLSLLRFLLVAALSFSMSFTPSNMVVSQLSAYKVSFHLYSLVKQLLVHSNERNYNATYCVTGSCTSKWNNMKIIGHTSNWCKPVFFIQYQ